MNIMDMFRTTPANINAPAADTKPAAPTDKQTQQQASSTDAKANDPSKTAENPFDTYQQVFDNAAKNSDIQAPSFALDPKLVHDVASKMDFTKGISPELFQKANGGDAASMMALIQEVGRNSYRAAIEHSTKLTDTHLGQRSEFESKQLKRGVKQQLTSDALASTANLSHPLIKQELNQIANRFANSPEYADATPAQIAQAAKDYFNELHAAINPATKTAAETKAAEGIDYMAYLTGK